MKVVEIGRSVMSGTGVDGATVFHEGPFLVVTPTKVITAKYGGEHHKEGDTLLLLADKWVARLPEGITSTKWPRCWDQCSTARKNAR